MQIGTCCRYVATVLVVVAIGCGGGAQEAASAPEQAAQPKAPATGGVTGSASIHGTVTLSGAAPAADKLQMQADPVCHEQHGTPVVSEDVVAHNGQLANALVYVKDGLTGNAFPAPSVAAILDQKGCLYMPHVVALQTNQALEIRNSDSTLHNVNAKPKSNRTFNVAQPVQGMKSTKTFTTAELGIPLKCNVHPWMHAVIHVLDHPFFAVTGTDGAFHIAGLPAGTYTLEVWHDTLGTTTQHVTVADGATQEVSFTLSAN